ncbi:Cephalosporin-C deacetylase [Streptococcus constellatus]|uniref:Cephalosporin-C deacetylase n=1 Tax=Streptococcus constellatus TaxID=76860 RepID=A0A564SS79_STRCV|nr:acetylxylan esterase [Streptococcus constellatus]VUW91481.1 Cephalosporin-C deacetylase [Streptococcus gordonii]VUW98005.1 Cephalosporin-C deacetylase [Streptococcus constellatus]
MRNPSLLEEAKTYQGRDKAPDDFDAFWDKNIAELPLSKEYQLLEKNFNIPKVTCYEILFKGTNKGQVYAKFVVPQTEEKVPVIFHFHGYMGRSWDWADMLAYTTAGYGVVSMDVRGQSGYSVDGGDAVRGNTVKGQIIRGAVDGPERLFYKDVYLDVYSLIEIVAGMDLVDENQLSSFGASQGGALALVAAALNPRIQQVVAIYPFLSDFRRVLEIGNTSEAYDELFRYFKFHDPFHETEEQIIRTLSYIDVKNLAHRIHCPVQMIIGLADDVCYPITQFAIFNHLAGEKEYHLMPEYEHEAMNVYVNDRVFNWLCGTNIENDSLVGMMKE